MLRALSDVRGSSVHAIVLVDWAPPRSRSRRRSSPPEVLQTHRRTVANNGEAKIPLPLLLVPPLMPRDSSSAPKSERCNEGSQGQGQRCGPPDWKLAVAFPHFLTQPTIPFAGTHHDLIMSRVRNLLLFVRLDTRPQPRRKRA